MTYRMTYDCDVLVAGGGCAGVCAALAAARNGARTLVIERAPFAGGIITATRLPYFDGIAGIRDKKIVVRGIPLELLVKMGACSADATHVSKHNPTIDNIEKFKRLLDDLLTSEGDRLQVLYHSFVCDVRVSGDHITDVIVANKAGLVQVRPKVVIDCTGDADVAFWAGVPTEMSPEVQPLSLHYHFANVHPTPETSKRRNEAIKKAHERGDLPMFYFWGSTRIPADASNPEDLTRAEMQGRKDAWTIFEALKKEVPGYEKAEFLFSGPYIGVRETRRIVGQYVLTAEDITEGKQFDDAIATGCWYLDLHPNRTTEGTAQDTPIIQPEPYDIPYRTLLPQRMANLLVAGRCHSATQLAASSTRVTATAMALGQAGGTAAALAIAKKVSPQELDGQKVRQMLAMQEAGPVQV